MADVVEQAQQAQPPRSPNESSPSWRLIRLKTPNPKRGIHMLRWSAVWRGKSYEFHHDHGWYWVPRSLARYLATIPARHGVNPGSEGDEDHARAFMIVETRVQAKAYDDSEKRKNAARVSRNPSLRINGVDMTTSDLRGRRFDEIPDEDPDDPVIDEDNIELKAVAGSVANVEGELADQIAEAQRTLLGLLAKAQRRIKKRGIDQEPPAAAAVTVEPKVDGEDGDDAEASVARDDSSGEENPDLNTPTSMSARVDFKAEGDRPKKKIEATKPKAEERRTSRPADRSLRAAET